MAGKKKSVLSVGSNNLRTGLQSPAAKIFLVVIGIGILASIGFAVSLKNSAQNQGSGAASASGYGIQKTPPRGAVEDSITVRNLEEKSQQLAEASLEKGGSYAGSFTFEAAKVPQMNVKDGFDESGSADQQGQRYTDAEVMTELRKRASDLDRSEQQQPGRAQTSSLHGQPQGGSYSADSIGSGVSAPDRSYVNPQGQPMPYGLGAEDFKAIAAQLDAVGRGAIYYSSLPNGSLKAQEQAKSPAPSAPGLPQPYAAAQSNGNRNQAPLQAGSAGISNNAAAVNKRMAVAAGTICPARAESAINTDFNIPAFFELLDCGELTGTRARATVEKGPSDFVLRFSEFFATPKHNFVFLTKAEGISINIDKDGFAGVSQNVDNHWITRLGSAAILSLAKTEKEFISARGTSVISTGTSTSTTIAPLTDEEKNSARVAGLLEGSMDVITRDTQYGVNRQATMTRERNTVIGIQFLTNVEVADK